MMLGSALILTSCGGDAETVVDYADKFCDCMKENDNDMSQCASIVQDAQKKFPDGEKDFEARVEECGVNF